jgi:hypothetical protein
MKAGLVLLAAALPVCAQKLHVYSELTRIDPFGQVIPQDRGAEPRHILSPGVPRNAFSSVRVVIELSKPSEFFLEIAQNPENAVRPTLYKEVFEKYGNTWIPDKLEPVTVPYKGGAADFSIAGQKVVTFWLDMWVDRRADVDRVKVEPQLWVASINDWVIYPMEVRILEPVIPTLKISPGKLPGIEEPADRSVLGPMRATFCGQKEERGAESVTARALVRRNVLQHMALVEERDCAAMPKPGAGPEWYLKWRDALFRANSRHMP